MGESDDPIEAWRAVAAGWERRRALVWDSTRVVSERLVELLDPQPGETVLELACGPGDTGFLAVPRLLPGGRLVSTDAAPEMVETARRRAEELGLGEREVSFAVEDMTSLSLDDSSVDAVLCRWGLMLVPDMDAAASEIARVLRPGGRASVAVWADAGENDWITASGRSALALGLAEPADPEAPGPFRLSAEGRLEGVLEQGGLAAETVEDVAFSWRTESLAAWWDVARDTSRRLVLLLEQVTPEEADAIRTGAEQRLERYVEADGSLAVPGLARVALARKHG
jgi:SAM-dependent methyltransferase